MIETIRNANKWLIEQNHRIEKENEELHNNEVERRNKYIAYHGIIIHTNRNMVALLMKVMDRQFLGLERMDIPSSNPANPAHIDVHEVYEDLLKDMTTRFEIVVVPGPFKAYSEGVEVHKN